MPDQNGTSRLDRIEHALELLIGDHIQFREEHKLLLTAQVVLTDRLDQLTGRVDQLAVRMGQLATPIAELGAHADERLNALITIMDGLIRKQN